MGESAADSEEPRVDQSGSCDIQLMKGQDAGLK